MERRSDEAPERRSDEGVRLRGGGVWGDGGGGGQHQRNERRAGVGGGGAAAVGGGGGGVEWRGGMIKGMSGGRVWAGGGKMPWVGLGTWKMSDAEAEAAVREAIEVGYRHLDTAAVYGNEAGVGKGIRDSGVRRG